MSGYASSRNDRTWRYRAPPIFSEHQRSRWQSLLEQRTGISYALHTSILQAGIYRRMVELGYEDYDAYLQCVLDGIAGQREWAELLNYITVQDTRFFRDIVAFNYLQAFLMQRIPALVRRGGTLEMWSAGCASGEEAWSMALLASHCIEMSCSQLYFGVLGSDISTGALAKARRATYRASQVNDVDPQLCERWLQPCADGYRVAPELAERVCFVPGNLTAIDTTAPGHMDVIFCQNVLIYFNQTCRCTVLDALAANLKPGGLLIVGAGEPAGWQHSDMSRVRFKQLEAYRRVS